MYTHARPPAARLRRIATQISSAAGLGNGRKTPANATPDKTFEQRWPLQNTEK
jgi:hypothetical protein